MQAICKEFDIFFKSFLQPFYFLGKNNLSENQKIIFNRWWNADEPRPLWYSEERINYINSEMKNMIQLSNKVDYIADFTNIFSNVDAVYYDYVHIYEKGNVILADAIYNEISNVLTRMKV